MPFLSSLDNLLHDAYIIFQKGVDNFEIEHRNCYFLYGVQYPLNWTKSAVMRNLKQVIIYIYKKQTNKQTNKQKQNKANTSVMVQKETNLVTPEFDILCDILYKWTTVFLHKVLSSVDFIFHSRDLWAIWKVA